MIPVQNCKQGCSDASPSGQSPNLARLNTLGANLKCLLRSSLAHPGIALAVPSSKGEIFPNLPFSRTTFVVMFGATLQMWKHKVKMLVIFGDKDW